MTIDVDDYRSPTQHEILAADINNRIAILRADIADARQDGREPFAEDADELDELVSFRDEVQARTCNHFDSSTIVPRDEFEDFARDWASEQADIEFLDPYVKWDEFATSLRSEQFIELRFGDDIVYVR